MLQKIKKLVKSIVLVVGILFLSLLTPQVHNQYLRSSVGGSVVQVLSPKGGGGTGFAVKADSGNEYIMTNRHVCEAAVNGWLLIKQDQGQPVFKRVVYKDRIHDLCLVEGDKRYSPLDLGKSLYKGESMYIVGHPGLRQLTVSEGEYIGFDSVELVDESVVNKNQCKGKIYELNVFEAMMFGKDWVCLRSYLSYATTAVAYGGNSGSPVVNKWGNVIGVLFAGSPRQNTDNFVVPLYEIKRVLSKF